MPKNTKLEDQLNWRKLWRGHVWIYNPTSKAHIKRKIFMSCTNNSKKKFIAKALQGATTEELSVVVGVSKVTVIKYLTKLGFTLRHVGRTPSGYACQPTSKRLINAVKNPVLHDGWPDAGNIELKIGRDTFKEAQWLRAAWLLRFYRKHVQVICANTRLEAALRKGSFRVYRTIADYIRNEFYDTGRMMQLWKSLLKVVPYA